MTEIKRYVPANDDRGEGTVVRNDQSGTVVFYDDHAAIISAKDERIAALQEQVRALAAEANYLRNEIKQHSASVHFCEVCGKDDPCRTDDVCWSLNHPLPSTDAVIREIRAQVLDDMAADCDGEWLETYIYALRDRAAAIRSGEQP